MARWRDRIFVMIGTCLGLGYCPGAPGTFGALLGVAIFVLIRVGLPAVFETCALAAAFLAVCALTVALGPWAEGHWGKKDPGCFVLDEVAGFLLTVLLFRGPQLLWTVIGAFVATRVADIIKPPPARRLEQLPGGWGILADDLCSSLYAVCVLYAAAALLPALFRAGG